MRFVLEIDTNHENQSDIGICQATLRVLLSQLVDTLPAKGNFKDLVKAYPNVEKFAFVEFGDDNKKITARAVLYTEDFPTDMYADKTGDLPGVNVELLHDIVFDGRTGQLLTKGRPVNRDPTN